MYDVRFLVDPTTKYRITGYLCDPEIYAFWPKKAILKCMQILFMLIYLYHIILRRI